MGWFNNNKPKEGDIYWTELPEENKKLKGTHPVIIESNNKNKTSNVIGCSTKNHPELNDVKVNSDPKMIEPTYARIQDGLRIVDTSDLEKDYNNAHCNNLKDIRRKLK